MIQLKKLLNRLIFPHPAVIAVCTAVSVVLLVYVFAGSRQKELIAYPSYILSAYTLTVLCVKMPKYVKAAKRLTEGNRLYRRYKSDIDFRTHMSLYTSLSINLIYAAVKMFCGIYYSSVWFWSVSVYYILLALTRFFLLRHINKNSVGTDIPSELRRYRLCGVILLIINQSLAVIVVLMVYQNRGYEYPGTLIYAAAAYTFYAFITAVVSLVKQRRLKSPVISAAKIINLTAAAVSVLSLETAMLSSFGNADDPMFRRILTGSTGGVICTAVLALAVYMIIRAQKSLKSKK